MDALVATLQLSGRLIGHGQPCFVIAEAGVNHDGRVEMAKQLIDAAADAQVDAVKFQTFRAERLAVPGTPKAAYQLRATQRHESHLDMLRRLELSEAAHQELSAYCRTRRVLFLSSPFDEESVDLLERLQVPAFKVPSGELTNLPLLSYMARHHRPMIVSTGMATLQEVETAVRTIHAAGNRQIVLLHCVSSYPADPAEANLRAMETMAKAFRVPVGYSDHTPGLEVAFAAVSLGACVLEKHLTLDRRLPGPDHCASIEPGELRVLVQGIRTIERALGDGQKRPAPSERPIAAVARKSLVAARAIPRGTRLTEHSITMKRPGTGLPPVMRSALVGRTAKDDIPDGTLLTLDMVG